MPVTVNSPGTGDTKRMRYVKILRALQGLTTGGQCCVAGAPPPIPPPPSNFTNVAVSASQSCADVFGIGFEGPAACCAVNAGVTASTVSQADADQRAIDIADTVLFQSQAGPCCQVPTTLSEDGWFQVSGPPTSGVYNNGITVTWAFNQALAQLTFNITIVPDVNRPDSNSAGAIGYKLNYCNPWGSYNFSAHLAYSYDITGINGVGGAAEVVILYAEESLIASPTFNPAVGSTPLIKSGSQDWVPFAPLSGGDSLQFQISLGNSFTDHAAFGSFSGTLTLGPLAPQENTQPCTVISSWTPPANDYFANATVITGTSGSIAGTNVDATLETGEPSTVNGSNIQGSIWYKWVAPSNGSRTFTTAGSTIFISDLAIYTGSAVNALTLVGWDNGSIGPPHPIGSTVTFTAASGTTYWIQVSGNGGGTGNTLLTWS